MKKCSTLLVMRSMKIKTTTRYHHSPVRMAVIKKSINNKCWRRCGEKGTFLHCWWECKLVLPLWKRAWFSQKTKNRTIIRSSNPTPGHISRKEKNFNSKKHTYLNFHSSTVYKSQDMVRTQVPTNRWLIGLRGCDIYTAHIYILKIILYIYIYTHTYI